MAKAYWFSVYRSISNPAALAEYAKLAGPAITAGGGTASWPAERRQRPMKRASTSAPS